MRDVSDIQACLGSIDGGDGVVVTTVSDSSTRCGFVGTGPVTRTRF